MLFETTDKVLARVFAKIEIQDLGYITPCHIWTGGTSGEGRGGGYGRMSLYGCTTAVHLFMWRKFKGPIRKNYQIDHKCNNRLCCNLDHLQMVTNLKNQRLRAKRTKEKAREVKKPRRDVSHEFQCDAGGAAA